MGVQSHVALSDNALRSVEVAPKKNAVPTPYPTVIEALNPWGYWQAGDGPPTAADSASPTRLGQGGAAWNSFPIPPPNPLAWGSTIAAVPGLLNDTRKAALTAVGTTAAPCSDSWTAGADTPWWTPGANGTWFHFTIQRVATPTKSNVLIRILNEIGTTTEIRTDETVFGDLVVWASPGHTGSRNVYWNTTATMPVGKKSHIIVLLRNGSTAQFTAKAWIDGVSLGEFTSAAGANLSTGFLTEGFEFGLADGISFEDVAIGSGDVSAGSIMNDATALSLYNHWKALL